MKYQPLEIVMLRPKYGGRIYAITEVNAERFQNPYRAVKLHHGPLQQHYLLNDGMILSRIGTLDPEALQLDPGQVDPPSTLDWQIGEHFALYMAQRAGTELDRKRWAFLATLKPGDPITLLRYTARGESLEQHRFREVLPSGQKYHFSAINSKGKVYRWTLESVHLGTDAGPATGL